MNSFLIWTRQMLYFVRPLPLRGVPTLVQPGATAGSARAPAAAIGLTGEPSGPPSPWTDRPSVGNR